MIKKLRIKYHMWMLSRTVTKQYNARNAYWKHIHAAGNIGGGKQIQTTLKIMNAKLEGWEADQ